MRVNEICVKRIRVNRGLGIMKGNAFDVHLVSNTVARMFLFIDNSISKNRFFALSF